MTMQASSLFSRFVGGLFGAQGAQDGRDAQGADQPQAPAAPVDVPHVVGQGGPNETLVHIAGVPHLFVDEGSHVVEFMPAFESGLRNFDAYGLKMLPDLAPHWDVAREHGCDVKSAVMYAIRSGRCETTLSLNRARAYAEDVTEVATEQFVAFKPEQTGAEVRASDVERPAKTFTASPATAGGARDRWRGKVVSWGEEEFPRRDARKGQKPTYRSFALRLQFNNGAEKVLQGEGLKDAIRAASCQIGQTVSVQRLGKEKVPAFNDDGTPLMRNGERIEWDRWMWKITH